MTSLRVFTYSESEQNDIENLFDHWLKCTNTLLDEISAAFYDFENSDLDRLEASVNEIALPSTGLIRLSQELGAKREQILKRLNILKGCIKEAKALRDESNAPPLGSSKLSGPNTGGGR
jgi:hypothetical protein